MNRKLLKDNAKIALKRNFWLVMLVVLVANILGVGDAGVGSASSGYSGGSSYQQNDDSEDEYDFEDWGRVEEGFQTMSYAGNSGQMMRMGRLDAATAGLAISIIAVIFFGVLILAFVVAAFLTYPVQVGYRRFFMLNRLNKGRFADLFSSFCSKYMNIVKGMFTTNMIIFGWTLLFIIPGIIKAYQYFFVPFILSENPDISGKRAREISTEMTDGHKWHIFVLGLSFIGWNLLAALLSIPAMIATCCFMGIGATLVYVPLGGYMAATYAELYEERREYILFTHRASAQELCGFEEPKAEDIGGFVEQPVMMDNTVSANAFTQEPVKSEEVNVETTGTEVSVETENKVEETSEMTSEGKVEEGTSEDNNEM